MELYGQLIFNKSEVFEKKPKINTFAQIILKKTDIHIRKEICSAPVPYMQRYTR